MALITKSRRTLLIIIVLAMAGIVGIRQSGKAALQNALEDYASKAGPVDSSEYAPAKVENRLNIARYLGAGVALIDMKEEDRAFLRGLSDKNPTELDDVSCKRVEELVKQNEFQLQILYKTIPLKDSSLSLHYGFGAEMPIPNLLEYLQASFLLGGKWRVELQKQDLASATQTVSVQERMASALTHEPVVITGLIGHAAERDFHEFIHRNLNSTDLSLLKKEMEYLNHLKSMATPPHRVIAADVAAIYSSLSSSFDDELYEMEPLTTSQRLLLKTSYTLNRPRFLAKTLGVFSDVVQYAREPVAGQAQTPINGWWATKVFFSSDLDTLVRRYQIQDAARNLALIAVQIRLQGLKDGEYPKSVTLPRSICTGEIASYIIRPDESAEISFPQTGKVWDQKFDKIPPGLRKPHLAWHLPPLN